MNTVEISFSGIRETPDFEFKIRDFCLKVMNELQITNWEVSILICNDKTIRELNRDFRQKDEATDVLSFNQSLDVIGDVIYAGDIVVSLETLEQHTELFKVSLNEELKRVLIHGILHLNGLDHETNAEGEEMLQMQEKILDKLSGEFLL